MAYYTESEGQALRELFEARVLQWPMVTTRRMFGCPAYLVDGKLFAFLVSQGVVITQIRIRDREALAGVVETEPFKAGEREIERWLQVTLEDDLAHFDRVMTMVKKSYDTVLNY
jgi:TfoX/Sxy family transcriptional regulator of competence genes